MDTKRGSSYRLWNKRLDGDLLTKGQIQQWCQAIEPGAQGYMIGGAATNLTELDCVDLRAKFHERCGELDGGGYRLTPEHERIGLEWLKSRGNAAKVGVPAEALRTFYGFRFRGGIVARVNEAGVRASFVPVYRVLYVVSDNGKNYGRNEFADYSWSPWQAKAYS